MSGGGPEGEDLGTDTSSVDYGGEETGDPVGTGPDEDISLRTATDAGGGDPTPVGPIDEDSIFACTPEQIQARIGALREKDAEVTKDEQFELAQLQWREAKRKSEACEEHERKMREIDDKRAIWDYGSDYISVKKTKIDKIKEKLKTKLDATTLTKPEKTELIDSTVKKLTDKDHTVKSMSEVAGKVEELKEAEITDKKKASELLDTAVAPLVERRDPAKTKEDTALPSAKVPTNTPQKVEIPKINPFVLSSRSVMGRMFEAFIKSFMTYPWQMIFEVAMRAGSEAGSKPYGMLLTLAGGALKIVAFAGQLITFGRLDMRIAHRYSDTLLAYGMKYDGTLPSFYYAVTGRLDKATENFANSMLLMPLRVVCQLPLGSGVWNGLNSVRCAGLAVGSVFMSGYHNGLGFIIGKFGRGDAAEARYKTADSYNVRTRFYANASVGILAHMLTHPISSILAPAPISEGGDIVKQAGYRVLEESYGSWFGPGNMGRWLSDTYKRGNIDNNPSIKTVAYFSEQAKQLGEVEGLLKTTTLSKDKIGKIIEDIEDGRYPKEEMDAYIARLKAELKPRMTEAEVEAINTAAKGATLKNKQGVNATRLLLDWFSTAFTWGPLGLVLLALSPVLLVVAPFVGLVRWALGSKPAASTAPAVAPPAPPVAHEPPAVPAVEDREPFMAELKEKLRERGGPDGLGAASTEPDDAGSSVAGSIESIFPSPHPELLARLEETAPTGGRRGGGVFAPMWRALQVVKGYFARVKEAEFTVTAAKRPEEPAPTDPVRPGSSTPE